MADLVSLSDVKAWLGQQSITTASDSILAGLITGVNQFVLGYIGRGLLVPQSFVERIDGVSYKGRIILMNYPVTSITSVIVDGQTINPVINPLKPANGYLLSPPSPSPAGQRQFIDFFGLRACPSRQNISISYRAGYQVSGESVSIPAGLTYTAQAPYGAWRTDEGVTYQSTGQALVAVSASPLAGQYSVTDGVYTFAAADMGKIMLINYGYIPFDIQQAAKEMIVERYKYKDRIGVNSASLSGQETVSYSNASVTEAARMMLKPYRRVF